MRDRKPEDFFYLDHRTVNAKFNIITDTHFTARNIVDSELYWERLMVQKEKFDFAIEAIVVDEYGSLYLKNARQIGFYFNFKK